MLENRSFFLALFKYSQNLGRRECQGCVHSALELTKCLLYMSLSPLKDPLCSLLCLDYWALRSAEYDWVLQFNDSFLIHVHVEQEKEEEELQMDALRKYQL